MSEIWISGDYHFLHWIAIDPTKCGRPYSHIHEHDEALIEIHNKFVKKGDMFIYLGDFGIVNKEPKPVAKEKLQAIFDKLNGQKCLVRGNHDRDTTPEGWQWIKDVYGFTWNKKHYTWLSHYAHRYWNRSHYGTWHLYAHNHGNSQPWGQSFDAGFDVWGQPINYDIVKTVMAKLEPTPPHHNDKPRWDGWALITPH